MQILNLLLFITIFLLPLITAYKGFGYEQSKVLFFTFSISLIGFWWLFTKPKIKLSNISKASGLFILVLLLTSFFGTDPKNSFLGKEPYYQGWIVYAYLFILSILISQIKIKLDNFAVCLTASAIIVATLAIKDWILKNIFDNFIPTYAGRVVSTFGQPNFFAGFLLFTLPFSYILLKNSNRRLQFLGWSSGVISLIGIIVSYSRSAILLALILLILALIDQLKIKKFLVAVFMIIIFAIFLSINLSSGFVWKEFLHPFNTSNPDLTKESIENRIYIWPQAVKIAWENPVRGYGLENIKRAFFNYFEKYKHPIFEENLKVSPVLISLKDLNIDRTHNYILDLFLFSGILGVLAWLILVSILLKKNKNTTILIGLITYLIWIQFQNQSVMHLVYFWILVGLIDRQY